MSKKILLAGVAGGVPSNDMTKEQQAELMRKWEQGPGGFLVFHPQGMPAMSTTTLLTELGSNILAALVAMAAILKR